MERKDKIDGEFRLIKYFSEFENAKISVFKRDKEFPNPDNRPLTNEDLAEPKLNDVYDYDLFESFYKLKFNKQSDPEPLFIRGQLKYMDKFSQYIKDEFPIFEKWHFFLEEKQKQNIVNVQSISEQEMPDKIKLRHSLLLMYELGVIDCLMTELKSRGIDMSAQKREYLSNLLSVLMNVNDKSTRDTIRKEISGISNIKTPVNSLNKILAGFGLEVNKLKKE
jgi:hypothetical protein